MIGAKEGGHGICIEKASRPVGQWRFEGKGCCNERRALTGGWYGQRVNRLEARQGHAGAGPRRNRKFISATVFGRSVTWKRYSLQGLGGTFYVFLFFSPFFVSTCYMLHMLYLSDDSNLLNSFDNSFMAVGCRPILDRTGSTGELADDAL